MEADFQLRTVGSLSQDTKTILPFYNIASAPNESSGIGDMGKNYDQRVREDK